MAHEEVNVCGGLLVVKSDSGRPKIEKVLVETKPGKQRNELKCRIQKWVEGKKISALIMPRRKSSSSLIELQEDIKSSLNQTSGDFLDVGKPVQCLELPVPKSTISVSKSEEEKVIRTENYDIDDDIISSDQSEDILTTTLLTTDEENKDSTIHLTFDDSNEDFESDEKSILAPKENQKEIKMHTSLVTAEPTPILYSSEKNKETSSEDKETVKLSKESDVPLSQSYIDSGLRRLKSEESHLLLDPFLHKKKRKPPSLTKAIEDPVKPILSELSSALFEASKVKTRRVEEPHKTEKSEESSDDLESTSELSEETATEEEPLQKLKDLEDKKFKIILPSKTVKKKKVKEPFAAVREVVHPTSKGDFCVHTEEVPVEKKSSEEFCLHQSKSASSLSVRFRDLTRSKSQGFSSISLIDNKEMRRSKYSKINLSKN